jgi:hypothetical protein
MRLPDDPIQELKIRAVRERISVQELAARAFKAYLKQRAREGK